MTDFPDLDLLVVLVRAALLIMMLMFLIPVLHGLKAWWRGEH